MFCGRPENVGSNVSEYMITMFSLHVSQQSTISQYDMSHEPFVREPFVRAFEIFIGDYAWYRGNLILPQAQIR